MVRTILITQVNLSKNHKEDIHSRESKKTKTKNQKIASQDCPFNIEA